MSGRLKLRNKRGELRPEVEDWDQSELDLWIADRIPCAPPGTMCEDPDHPSDDPSTARSYFWTIKDGHVCYHYCCDLCAEGYDEGADPESYPTTKGGYAVTPRHCTT